MIATENASGVGLCTTCYLSYDHLGSVRLVTDQNGVVKARHDFLPYGEEVPASTAGRSSQFGSTTDAAQKFTGQIRDQEATMDYFNARYFVAALSRFTSPDPGNAGADLTDPQTWNAYAYVRNSPLHMVDPSGMDGFGNGDDGGWGDCWDDPFACDGGWGPFPPGGGSSSPEPPPPVQTEGQQTGAPLPRGSFPGGEKLGIAAGDWGAICATGTSRRRQRMRVGPCSGGVLGFADSSSSYPLSAPLADLFVSIYAGANGFGHAGIGVNSKKSVGLYPAIKPPCLLFGCTVKGIVKLDNETPLRTVRIPTTSAQDTAAQSAIDKAIRRPPNYNLLHQNCASFVESILNAVGIKNVPTTILPNSLGDALGCKP